MPADTDILIALASTVPVTEAEGPGRRFALWVQGCPLRCPGCCNPEYLRFDGGTPTPVTELVDEILATPGIEGVTLLGGEPFSHAEGLAELSHQVRLAGLSVMIFTGNTIDEIRAGGHTDDRHRERLLRECDLLVDGPYLRENHTTNMRWIGSTNQRVHFLTDRYAHLDDGRWERGGNTLEIRMIGGEITINGFPHPDVPKLGKPRRQDSRND